jgi:hypothetical protein
MNRVLLISPDRAWGFKLIVSGNRELGIGNWAWGMGHWALVIEIWQEKWIISIFSLRDYQLPITHYPLPITHYRQPSLSIHRQSARSSPLHGTNSQGVRENSLTLKFRDSRFNFHFHQPGRADKNRLID